MIEYNELKFGFFGFHYNNATVLAVYLLQSSFLQQEKGVISEYLSKYVFAHGKLLPCTDFLARRERKKKKHDCMLSINMHIND